MAGPSIKSVQIQTTTECNRECPWCPNKDFFQEPQLMSEETLLKVLEALKGFQGHIHPYLMAEPLCDHRIIEIVKIIRVKFPKNRIFISTNGDYLDERVMNQLLDAGLTEALVCHYDRENEFLLGLAAQYPEFEHRGIGELRPAYYNRGGHAPISTVNKLDACDWLWSKLYVNWKGECILCCSDYGFEVVMGDLTRESLRDIWMGEKYGAYRWAHRNGVGSSMPLCQKCNRIRQEKTNARQDRDHAKEPSPLCG